MHWQKEIEHFTCDHTWWIWDVYHDVFMWQTALAWSWCCGGQWRLRHSRRTDLAEPPAVGGLTRRVTHWLGLVQSKWGSRATCLMPPVATLVDAFPVSPSQAPTTQTPGGPRRRREHLLAWALVLEVEEVRWWAELWLMVVAAAAAPSHRLTLVYQQRKRGPNSQRPPFLVSLITSTSLQKAVRATPASSVRPL